MRGVLDVDGSFGEGGGQVLRTALSLSLSTGRAIRISNIRAGRTKPGLGHQHLTCVRAARQVASAIVSGAELGSGSLEFAPGQLRPGNYAFDVVTAGSASLVLQALFLPLSLVGGESHVVIRGGTHVKWSPSYEFLEDQWLHYLLRAGFGISLQVDGAGYYPRGGGVLKARIEGARQLRPLNLTDRGKRIDLTGRVFYSHLKRSIALRQLTKSQDILASRGVSGQIECREYPSCGQGTGTHLRMGFGNGSGSFTSLGELGVPAEQVAATCVQSLLDYVDSGAAVDRFMADQLILPLCFADGESSFTTEKITKHLLANAEVVRWFDVGEVKVEGEPGGPGTVHVIPGESIP